MTSPIDRRAAAIEAVLEARKILSLTGTIEQRAAAIEAVKEAHKILSLTGPVDRRAEAIEAVKEAHKILGEHQLMSPRRMAQLERVALGLSDLDRGVVSPLTRPAPRTGAGRPRRDSEEVLLIAAARAMHAIFAKEIKFLTSDQDVAETLSVRGYTLGDGTPITAETIRGWRGVKDLRVLRLTKGFLAIPEESPTERVGKILRFIGERVTALPQKPIKSRSKKRAI